jgi:hypothetical protein
VVTAYKRKQDFFETEEGVEVERILKMMVANEIYNTESSYSANSELYPDNRIPFVNKHMAYLRSHPATDPEQYLANLRLMTRVR